MIHTLADILRYHSETQPDALALKFNQDNRQWSFRELNQHSSVCANAMRSQGISKGSRIAYLGKNEPEYFIYLFGGAKLGAAFVAVNWRLSPKEMEYILNHSESEILLVGDEFLQYLPQMNLNIKKFVVLGDPGDSGHASFNEWLQEHDIDDPVLDIDPSDTCYQFYTSGTTGRPKGVETTHNNLIAMLGDGLAGIGVNRDSINLCAMPLFHISGSGWGVLGLYRGCTTILLREVNLPEIVEVVERDRVTHAVFVPALLQSLASLPDIENHDFSSLVSIIYGASPITEPVLTAAMRLFQCDFYQVYGLTETTGGVTKLDASDHDPGGEKSGLLRSCGKPVLGHKIKIVDENGIEQPEGEIGEIWMHGPQIMKGYWRNESATIEAITPDGWFKSGDAGYLIDGYLYIHDRLKDMIISGGENIYPAEVENILMKHDKIQDAAVIGIPSTKWGETVKAIVTRTDDSLTEDDVIQYCRNNLAHYKCPTSVDWMDEIPRNPSGKILKVELRKPYWSESDRNVS